MPASPTAAAKKPAPDVYDLALKRLGLPAAQALALEDSRNGVLSARAAGLISQRGSAIAAHGGLETLRAQRLRRTAGEAGVDS